MLSKLVRSGAGRCWLMVFSGHSKLPKITPTRMFSLIPPTQYDMPWPKRLSLRYVLRVYWETIPLFACVLVSGSLVVVFSVWSLLHKVDVVYKGHNNENISRTMDLRNPTIHQIMLVNKNSPKYEPWPEMQDVLDKIKEAESKATLEPCKGKK